VPARWGAAHEHIQNGNPRQPGHRYPAFAVEWHLRNVSTKLGIRSRRELPNALAGPDSQLLPA